MKSLNETIKSTNNCEHSIKLLTDIILGIEAYPELHKTLEISKNIDKELNEYLEKINKECLLEHKKIDESNIRELKETLAQLEHLIKIKLDKSLNNNIEKRINYLNLENIKNTYQQDEKEKLQQISQLKSKIKNLLTKLDKSLPLYAQIKENDTGYTLIETLENKITIKEIFDKIPIEKICKDLELEDYEQDYYYQLEKEPLDLKYHELYIHGNEQSKLKKYKKLYPNIYVAKQLINIKKDGNPQVLANCIFLAKLILKVEQLENLKEHLEKREYNLTVNHVTNLIKEIQEEISTLEDKIDKTISQEISKLNIRKSLKEQDPKIKELIKTILEITENITKEKFGYNLNDIYYKKLIEEDLKKYQQVLLQTKYNISIKVEELKDLLVKQTTPNKRQQKNNKVSLPNPLKRVLKKKEIKK